MARPPCERPGLLARGPASLYKARPPYDLPCLPVEGPVVMWEAPPPCERLGFPLRGPASLRGQNSLWEARPPCGSPNIWVMSCPAKICFRLNKYIKSAISQKMPLSPKPFTVFFCCKENSFISYFICLEVNIWTELLSSPHPWCQGKDEWSFDIAPL